MFSPTAAKALDPYEFQSDGYATQGKGGFNPQLLNSFVPYGRKEGEGGTSSTFASQGMIRTAIELEYGLTNKIEVASYFNFARPAGENFQFAGVKGRLRGRFAGGLGMESRDQTVAAINQRRHTSIGVYANPAKGFRTHKYYCQFCIRKNLKG